jgi:hypothetical protein
MGESPAGAGGPRPEHRESPRSGDDRPRSGPSEVPVVEKAPEATACAYLGCTETEGLHRVETEEGARTLCPDHIEGWLER